jgi:hypothetical protein
MPLALCNGSKNTNINVPFLREFSLEILMTYQHLFYSLSLLFALCITTTVYAKDGKWLATAGLSQIEGAGGGSIVPWATLTGYDSQDQI